MALSDAQDSRPSRHRRRRDVPDVYPHPPRPRRPPRYLPRTGGCNGAGKGRHSSEAWPRPPAPRALRDVPRAPRDGRPGGHPRQGAGGGDPLEASSGDGEARAGCDSRVRCGGRLGGPRVRVDGGERLRPGGAGGDGVFRVGADILVRARGAPRLFVVAQLAARLRLGRVCAPRAAGGDAGPEARRRSWRASPGQTSSK